jgi:hypothetical protein
MSEHRRTDPDPPAAPDPFPSWLQWTLALAGAVHVLAETAEVVLRLSSGRP